MTSGTAGHQQHHQRQTLALEQYLLHYGLVRQQEQILTMSVQQMHLELELGLAEYLELDYLEAADIKIVDTID